MAITDIFKKENNNDATVPAKKDKKSAPVKTEIETKVSRKVSGQAARVLIHAHVTEKASSSAEKNNQYIFRVAKFANKQEVARAIESYYQVDVVGVNTINIPGKRKRRGRGITIEPGYRKAIVKIKKGQSIEVLPQ